LTVLDSPAALQKLTRYLREKVRETGSVSSMSTLNSGLSTLVWLRRVTAPFPISPAHVNLTPSLEASIETVTHPISTSNPPQQLDALTGLGESHKVHADSLEFCTRHADCGRILSIWDSQVFLIDIHELQIILAQSVA
jgi:hypothetical protein